MPLGNRGYPAYGCFLGDFQGTILNVYMIINPWDVWPYHMNHAHGYQLVGPRPLDGRGVLLGWGGACINVHVNLHMK